MTSERPTRILGLVALVALLGFAFFLWRRHPAAPETGAARTAPMAPAGGPEEVRTPTRAAPAAAQPVAAPPPKASLIVRLRDAGKPAPGVGFTMIEERTHHMEELKTGPDGAHAVLGLPPGEYHITVRHPDFVFAAAHPRIEGEGSQEVVIDLDRGARVEGRVSDELGNPLEGARAFLMELKPGNHLTPTSLESTSDREGHYRIVGIPVGTYGAQYFLSGRRRWGVPTLAVTQPGQEFGIDVILRGGRSITGTVVKDDGSPVEGASVVGTNEETATTRTAADGTFSLNGLGDSPVMCFASALGYGATYLRDVAAGSANIVFRLSKAGEVSGKIVAQPLPARFTAHLTRFDPDRGRFVPLYPMKFSGDAFRVGEVPVGRYRVEVHAEGYETEDVPELDVAAGQSLTGVQVRLRKKS